MPNHKQLYGEHLRYLKEIVDFEESRQTTIENKLSHIIGQSGIVLSLVSLFVPFFYDKLDSSNLVLKVTLILLFVIGFAGFVISLLFATKTFNIKKYIYQSGSTQTVLKGHKQKEDFLKEEIDDLVSIVQANISANNLKGTSLIRAARYFTFGLFAVGLLGIVLTVNVLFMEKKEAKITLSNQLDITSIETSLIRIGSDFDSLNVSVKKLLDTHDKAKLSDRKINKPGEAR